MELDYVEIFIKNILGARIVCALGKNDSGISGLINGWTTANSGYKKWRILL